MSKWISGATAARIMGVHRNTVLASLRDPDRRALWWGEEGDRWRHKPLSTRRIFEVDSDRARQLACGQWPPKETAEAPTGLRPARGDDDRPGPEPASELPGHQNGASVS